VKIDRHRALPLSRTNVAGATEMAQKMLLLSKHAAPRWVAGLPLGHELQVISNNKLIATQQFPHGGSAATSKHRGSWTRGHFELQLNALTENYS
jgi:hypothetical protein